MAPCVGVIISNRSHVLPTEKDLEYPVLLIHFASYLLTENKSCNLQRSLGQLLSFRSLHGEDSDTKRSKPAGKLSGPCSTVGSANKTCPDFSIFTERTRGSTPLLSPRVSRQLNNSNFLGSKGYFAISHTRGILTNKKGRNQKVPLHYNDFVTWTAGNTVKESNMAEMLLVRPLKAFIIRHVCHRVLPSFPSTRRHSC